MEALQSTIMDFDPAKFSSYMTTNRSFKIDLSKHSLIGVLEAYESYKQRTNDSEFSNDPIKTVIKNLQEYLKGQVIMPIDVTTEFYNFAISFLYSGKNGKPLKPSTINNYLSGIQSALRYASEHNCTISETYNKFNVDDYEKSKVVLSIEDIAIINSFDIEAYKTRIKSLLGKGDGLHDIRRFSFACMQCVKDHFVLSCNLGQRISDTKRIEPYMFDETGTIFKCVQQKTGGKATVYIPKYSMTKKIALQILKKYNYRAPAFGIDTTNFNRYVKLIMHAIGGDFLEVERWQNKILGQIVSEECFRWQLITSHTARRTFITNCELENRSVSQICKCSGHKDIRMLQKYIITRDTE